MRWCGESEGEEGLKPWAGVRMVLLCGSPMPTHAMHGEILIHHPEVQLRV
jgi:hypothetical protein